MAPEALNLRDIHLPEPISWWPVAPGWWLLLAALCLIIIVFFISRKIYISRQLNRDIKAELGQIKQQFEKTQNKSELARSLSILLRRASISFYPATDIAGLTGESWLSFLDESNASSSLNSKFLSDTGKVLLSAPYLPESSLAGDNGQDYDAKKLIQLCESWLLSPHKKTLWRAAS